MSCDVSKMLSVVRIPVDSTQKALIMTAMPYFIGKMRENGELLDEDFRAKGVEASVEGNINKDSLTFNHRRAIICTNRVLLKREADKKKKKEDEIALKLVKKIERANKKQKTLASAIILAEDENDEVDDD